MLLVGVGRDLGYRIEIVEKSVVVGVVISIWIYRYKGWLRNVILGHWLIRRIRLKVRYRWRSNWHLFHDSVDPRTHAARWCRRLIINYSIESFLVRGHTFNYLFELIIVSAAIKFVLNIILSDLFRINWFLSLHATTKSARTTILLICTTFLKREVIIRT